MKDVITLVSSVRKQDEIGQWVEDENLTTVVCEVNSVSRSEWYDAGKLGLKAQFQFTIHFSDWHDEEVLIYQENRYAVYRTYRNGDRLELYAERQAGV